MSAKTYTSEDQFSRAIAKLERRITELNALDIVAERSNPTGAINVAISNFKSVLREVFGADSPEFLEYQHADMLSGPLRVGMPRDEITASVLRGRTKFVTVLTAMIERLNEWKSERIESPISEQALIQAPITHPKILAVSSKLFENGHHWEAVFAASKALMHLVKEKSELQHLDGTALVRLAFSRNNPVLAFSDLADQTKFDEQEGMMHLFEGVALGVRNPGGHSFPEGSKLRALEYMSLISLLAHRTDEAIKVAKT